ncbi:MAG: hypothetical protein PVJ86_05390 [Phycisphaerales bacterium]|jgi:hypothetical protein
MSKDFWKSKTIWFNGVAAVLYLVNQLGYADFVPDAGVMALVAAVVNIVLRFVTKQPVTILPVE